MANILYAGLVMKAGAVRGGRRPAREPDVVIPAGFEPSIAAVKGR